MKLYSSGGVTAFEIRKETPDFKKTKSGFISYLVEKVDGVYYSYGFDPRKRGALRYAKQNFRIALQKGVARRYNPDGGRLDGRDYRGH